MSKYDKLWEYLLHSGAASVKLSFDEIYRVAGVKMDHSFLAYKKELPRYGYRAGKISLKEQSVEFDKLC
jgi:hypothetical protein